MERSVAVKKLSKMLGKNFGYKIDTKALSADDRAAVQIDYERAAKIRDELKAKKNARFEALLKSDAEYQKLSADYKAADALAHRLGNATRAKKITVGISNSMFFHVKADGDSWEEVIEKVQNNKS